jgi:ankyrin repeat protein
MYKPNTKAALKEVQSKKIVLTSFICYSSNREPINGLTPFMEAATEGHEKIVQLFLQNVSLYVYLLNMSSEGDQKIVQLFLQHVSLYVYLLNMDSHDLTLLILDK